LNGFKGAGNRRIVQPPGEPEEREPRLARRSPFAPETKLCPRCLSPLKGLNKLGGWLIPQNYFCEKCGYTGTVFVEKQAEPEKGTE
jgi:transposase-like protein